MTCIVFEEFKKSLVMVTQLKGDVWVLGDLNFPKLAWDNEYIPSVRPGCSFPQLYEDFISALVQMVTEPTRGENILDLFLTSNHTLVKMWPFNQVFQTPTWFIRRSLPNQLKLGSPQGPHTYIEERTGGALRPIWRMSRRISWQTWLLYWWKNFGLLLNLR